MLKIAFILLCSFIAITVLGIAITCYLFLKEDQDGSKKESTRLRVLDENYDRIYFDCGDN